MKNSLLIIIAVISFSCKDEGVTLKSPAGDGCIDQYATNFNPTSTIATNYCEYEPIACSECDYILETGDLFLDNDDLGLPPGSVIGIRGGNRRAIVIQNFFGTSDQPYIFTNCDGRAILDVEDAVQAVTIINSHHLRLTGTGSDDMYGIKIALGGQGLRAHKKVDNLEIDHLEVTNVGIGLWTVTRPSCDGSTNRGSYVQENISIHDNYIHDTNFEGTYIGGSKWSNFFNDGNCPGEELYQADIKNVYVYSNILENIGSDGIQVGGVVEECHIFNNIVTNYGMNNTNFHQAGMMVNPGTSGKIYSNIINKGTGNGIFIQGFDLLVYSNLVIDAGQSGITVGDRSPLPNKSHRIINNTIINATDNGIYFNSLSSVNNVIYNNIIAGEVNNDFIFTRSANLVDLAGNYTSDLVDPTEFVDIANLDFSPSAGGTLINAGTAYELEELLYDVRLRARIVNSIDVGAFESPE